MVTSPEHENLLHNEISELEDRGWHALDIGRSIPDGIAITPQGKIIAIEVLGRRKRYDAKGRSKGYHWDGNRDINDKRWLYQKYDDIIFILFDRDGSGWKKRVLASELWPDIKKG